MADFARMRDNMVKGQILPSPVTDLRVIEAFRSIPREHFVPEELRPVAYLDESIRVARGRFLPDPMVFARLADAARIGANDVILDVGSTTGYSAAVLGRLASMVVALESDAALGRSAEDLLGANGADNVAVVNGPLAEGWRREGPYDVIILQGSVPAVPDTLINQLGPDGRLLAVEGHGGPAGRAILVQAPDGIVSRRELFSATLPPLPGFAAGPSFAF